MTIEIFNIMQSIRVNIQFPFRQNRECSIIIIIAMTTSEDKRNKYPVATVDIYNYL